MKTTRKVLGALGVVLAVSLLAVTLVPSSPVSAATMQNRPKIVEKRAEYRENRERNIALARENRELRLAIKERLAAVKGDLDQKTIDELKTMRDRLKKLVEDLKSTRGDIREVVRNSPMLIPGIQQARYQKLTAIHRLLQEMFELVS